MRSKPEEVVRFLVSSPFTYRLVQLDKALQKNFNAAAFPTNVVIDRQGNYAYESIG